MSLSGKVHAIGHAASAFLSTLAHRPPESPSQAVSEGAREEGIATEYVPFTATPQAGVENRCPVCQARFRGARLCSRCGADLEPLMALSVKSWQLREASRRALGIGDVAGALRLATEAQAVQDIESGKALRTLTEWLVAR